jgi:hypothetical protein
MCPRLEPIVVNIGRSKKNQKKENIVAKPGNREKGANSIVAKPKSRGKHQ